jgi:hypothetical protein
MSACPAVPRRAPGRASAEPRGRRAERGVSWVSLLLLLALAAGAYLAWVWVPVYIVHYEAKQVVRDFMNQAVKSRDDGLLQQRMVQRLERLHTIVGEDEAGRRVETPVIVIDPRELVWERDTTTTPPVLRVSLVYELDVEYPWLDRSVTKTFAIDLENDLAVPVW